MSKQAADLPYDRRSREPMVFLQDSSGEVLSQTHEVVLPYVGKVLAVVHTGGLIPRHEPFNEPEQESQNRSVTAFSVPSILN